MIVNADAELPHVVHALASPGGLTRGLNGRQQKRDKNPDDRNDHQKLYQCESINFSGSKPVLQITIHASPSFGGPKLGVQDGSDVPIRRQRKGRVLRMREAKVNSR